jgi:hypothetical protein
MSKKQADMARVVALIKSAAENAHSVSIALAYNQTMSAGSAMSRLADALSELALVVEGMEKR